MRRGVGAVCIMALVLVGGCSDTDEPAASIMTDPAAEATSATADAADATTTNPPMEIPAASIDSATSRLTVVGSGTAEGPADLVVLNLAVETTGASVGDALDEAETRGRDMLDALEGLDPPAQQLQTSSLNVYPMFFEMAMEPTYTATLTVTAQVTAEQASEAVDAAARAVGDSFRVYGMGWTTSDTEALLTEARAAAFSNASAIAEELAAVADVELGPIAEIRYGGESGGFPWPMTEGDSAGLPFVPGSSTVSASVTVVFDLHDLRAG